MFITRWRYEREIAKLQERLNILETRVSTLEILYTLDHRETKFVCPFPIRRVSERASNIISLDAHRRGEPGDGAA